MLSRRVGSGDADGRSLGFRLDEDDALLLIDSSSSPSKLTQSTSGSETARA